jgi:hypothetical protein
MGLRLMGLSVSVGAGFDLPLTGIGHRDAARELQVFNAINASFGCAAGDSGPLAVEPAAAGEHQSHQQDGEDSRVTLK